MSTLTQRNEESAIAAAKIHATEKLLYSLGDQILADRDQGWNILIGDDASGRLPTRFVRRILSSEGILIPTSFIVGSRAYRRTRGSGAYSEYVRSIGAKIDQPLRPLIVTESSSSGDTVDFLSDVLSPVCEAGFTPNVAAVATVEDLSNGRIDYIGGSGKEALALVGAAYENHPPLGVGRLAARAAFHRMPVTIRERLKRNIDLQITPPSPNHNAGIFVSLDNEQPIAQLIVERDVQLIKASARAIDSLADRYAMRSSQRIELPNLLSRT